MKRLLSLSLCLMMAMLSFAHDFEVKNADEKTIYYEITSSSDLTVAVTYQGTSYSEYMYEYTGSVTIPEKVTYNGKTYSVTSIGDGAFDYCSGLTSITIPNSVTSIGVYAFLECSRLTSVTIPNSVTSIGSDAFLGCESLTKVIVPDIAAWCNISFGNYAANPLYYAGRIFSDENTEITDLVIPNSVTTIGSDAFYGCSGLTSIVVENGNTKYDSRNNCNAIIETASNTLILGCKTTVIPNSVTSIGDYAFWYCSGLTSITIPNSVTAIGSDAFSFCSGLTSVTIGNSVTSIGSYAFYECSGLKSVTIPNSVTSIGSDAFSCCRSLRSVTIGNSVTSIGSYAFDECSGLKKVIVPDIAAWCKISFKSYDANPLYYAKHIYSDENTEITDLVIPNSVTSIGYGTFSVCSSLTSVTIPNSVTSIGNYAFAGCTGLTSVNIPNSVTSIGNYAFAGCTGLTSIISYIKEPFAIDSYCWYNVDNTISVYVPAGTKEQYQNTDGWDYFTNFIEFGAESIEPAEEAQEVDMRLLSEQIGLDGVVIGDTYYNIDTENGDNYDTENGCIILKTATTDEDVQAVSGLPLCDDQVKATFKGIIFMVPAGSGKVYVNAETVGSKVLMVKVGSQAAQSFQLNGRETVEVSYTVAEPSYIYIFASDTKTSQARGSRMAEDNEDCVKVYSYKWEPAEPTGIEKFTVSTNADSFYSIDGRKLSGKPVHKGIYIVNGRKVAVK